MDSRLEDLRSTRNPKARIKIMKGHFATSNSHLNTYIDMSTVKTTIMRAIESVLYYGGTVCGVCSIFSAVTKVAGMEIKTIFTSADVPAYHAYDSLNCPMCQKGERVEALVNSFGYSKLE